MSNTPKISSPAMRKANKELRKASAALQRELAAQDAMDTEWLAEALAERTRWLGWKASIVEDLLVESPRFRSWLMQAPEYEIRRATADMNAWFADHPEEA